MNNNPVTIREMELSDIPGGLRLSTEQGWNQTESDWRRTVGEKQNSCLLAECEGKVVGTTTAMNYSNEVAWIGMVLVDKAYRGRGISKLLLTEIFEKLSGCKSIKLDATPEGRNVYQKFGFVDEYKIVRMTRDPGYPMLPERDDSVDAIIWSDSACATIGDDDVSTIVALDRVVFGAERRRLIESLIKENPGGSWMSGQEGPVGRTKDKIAERTGDGHADGFVLGRTGRVFYQVGPVVAPDFLKAKMLVTKALAALQGHPVVVDIPSDKQTLIHWLVSIGFVEQRHFIRMYSGVNSYPGEISRLQLICGPELG